MWTEPAGDTFEDSGERLASSYPRATSTESRLSACRNDPVEERTRRRAWNTLGHELSACAFSSVTGQGLRPELPHSRRHQLASKQGKMPYSREAE
jgi:hypothetical protein